MLQFGTYRAYSFETLYNSVWAYTAYNFEKLYNPTFFKSNYISKLYSSVWDL
mgnify:CR=1 FL=1